MVFFLFLSERQIDEHLLQSFVDVIDTELFKAVAFEDFKAVNVEHTDALAACTNVAETVAADRESATSARVTPKIDSMNTILFQTCSTSEVLAYCVPNSVFETTYIWPLGPLGIGGLKLLLAPGVGGGIFGPPIPGPLGPGPFGPPIPGPFGPGPLAEKKIGKIMFE